MVASRAKSTIIERLKGFTLYIKTINKLQVNRSHQNHTCLPMHQESDGEGNIQASFNNTGVHSETSSVRSGQQSEDVKVVFGHKIRQDCKKTKRKR